ncbi:inner membrane protein [Albidovulum inexpectatum]|uniref:Inner membrane protein n=1 Tax=Albidovulum inexpectatum TaxID=196587 RepID=A0A2S5JM09_9RHOB|nr:mitofilin family membrane protein [Albidovulum inexpectatum]PPB82438.1 inner membrane protein [Albidovulum inexpectatum]
MADRKDTTTGADGNEATRKPDEATPKTPLVLGEAQDPNTGQPDATYDRPQQDADAETAAEAFPGTGPETGERPMHAQDQASEDETAPAAAPAPAPEEQPAPRRSGFWGPVFGGVVAAGLGFGLAVYALPRWMPEWSSSDTVTALQSRLDQATARIEELGGTVEVLRAAPSAQQVADRVDTLSRDLTAQVAAISDRVGGLETRVEELAKTLGEIDTRLSAVEKRPTSGGAASQSALEAFGREIEALRAEMQSREAEIRAAEERLSAIAADAEARMRAVEEEAARQRAEAEEQARRATIRAGLARLQAALEAGHPLQPALDDLARAGVEIPPALSDQAQGVPTLTALRESFAPAARAALAASLRETADGDIWARLKAFARAQTGARSLAPREGDDPDAILSRAEAALRAGDLQTALDEIATLPKAGQEAMSEWVGLAQRRLEAQSAIAAIAAQY